MQIIFRVLPFFSIEASAVTVGRAVTHAALLLLFVSLFFVVVAFFGCCFFWLFETFFRLIDLLIFPYRKLRHPHIVEYFGTTYRSVPRGIEAVFVTERPGETLKSYLVNHPGNNPADNSMSVLNVIRWAQQIVNALIFVHCMFQGCVHGDLRLENVLVCDLVVCFR